MFNKFKNNIRKYIRKYISFVFSLLLIPCLSINAFASSIIVDYSQSYRIRNDGWFNVFKGNYIDDNGNLTGSGSAGTGATLSCDSEYIYRYKNTANLNGYNIIGFKPNSVESFPVLVDVYDYYFVICCISQPDMTFYPDSLILAYEDNDTRYAFSYTDFIVNDYNTENGEGFSVAVKLDLSENFGINNIFVKDTDSGNIGKSFIFWASLIPVPKDTNKDAINDIVSAINYQNSLLESGDSDTQSAVSDFNQVFEDFNEELENWEQFDDEIIGEFNSANENYMSELNNFSLSGSLLNAGNWLSTSMQTVYDNSSDYKMLWLVPLLFGIPILLFIIRKTGDDE